MAGFAYGVLAAAFVLNLVGGAMRQNVPIYLTAAVVIALLDIASAIRKRTNP